MIFRSRRKREAETDEVETVDAETTEVSDVDDDPAAADDSADGSGSPAVDLAELDEQDWRDDGPWDITEVDDVDDDSDGPRIDLGSVVVTGHEGMELRLQVDEESQQIVSALMISDESALEVGAFAAPRSGGMWPELRDEMMTAATDGGGAVELAAGPFGVELRRVMRVRTPDGDEGYQPSRMWMVEGPRWMLRGVVFGAAALEYGDDGAVAPLLAAFRQIVVRRGAEAMAPGDLLPLSLPQGLTPDESTLEDD
jgi:hypothetical protein